MDNPKSTIPLWEIKEESKEDEVNSAPEQKLFSEGYGPFENNEERSKNKVGPDIEKFQKLISDLEAAMADLD